MMSALPKEQSSSSMVECSEFDEWYKEYPLKKSKGDAERAFLKARKSAGLPDLIEGVRRYIAQKPEWQKFCNPATWLNGKRWLDETQIPDNRPPVLPSPAVATDRVETERRAREWMRRLRQTLGHDPFAGNTREDFIRWYWQPKTVGELRALREVGWFGREHAPAPDPVAGVLREMGVAAAEIPGPKIS